MKVILHWLFAAAAVALVAVPATAADSPTWPYPVPCRIQDGANPDLFVTTLGPIETPIADGVFDPVKDQVTLKDGTVIENYYRDRLEIRYYQPIDKTHFPLPPSGWCSWYYYYQEINEDEFKRNAKWIAENLKDFGAKYVQLDDGWQGVGHGSGNNRDWLTIDKRFSGGMDNLAAYIKSLGLSPGIWLAPHGQSNEDLVKANPDAFLLKPDGTSASSTWEGEFLIDPTSAAGHAYLKELFTTMVGWGYDYFKIDGQPIVVREYKKSQVKAVMKNPSDDTNELYRSTLRTIHEAIGPDRYLLGCWVIPREGIGIMDGSRVSADIIQSWQGFKTALRSTMQYYFLHNIAWYCDPDVILVRDPLPLEQARAWATLQGMTSQALMTSDRLMDLSADRVELLKRVYPAVNIRPLDLFSNKRNKRIWDLKINHLGRNYDVVALFNYNYEDSESIGVKWSDLGLAEDKPIHIFDFWNAEYLGAYKGGLALNLPPGSCRVLSLLPDNGQVQLVSTSRHITQGWVDLMEVQYDSESKTCSGKSQIIGNDPYSLHFAFPKGRNFIVKSAGANGPSGDLPIKIANHDGWATVEIRSNKTTEVNWEASFEPASFYHFPLKAPANAAVEPVGVDGVNVRWTAQHQPDKGFRVYLNGKFVGFTPDHVFPLRHLDADTEYTVTVETAWHDGTVSEENTEVKFTPAALQSNEISLTEFDIARFDGGWRLPEINRNHTGRVITLANEAYKTGIGIPPNSEVEFEVKGAFASFSAVVGIDDGNRNNGQVEFILKGDGKTLWESGVISRTDGIKPVQVDIKGIQKLALRVNRGPNGGSSDEAVWGNPVLHKESE